MRLDTEFIKLPLRFDAERLAAAVAGVPEAAWRPHPQGHPGNSALPLIAAGGDPANDDTRGVMKATPVLAQLPYLRQLLAELRAPVGRTRLMRLDGNAEATAHADINYYWMERLRVHFPVVTAPEVEFLCGERSVHMAAGEVWVFDTWRIHNVLNPNPTRRIHLVADTVGSPELWDLVENGEWPFADPPRPGAPARFVPWRPELAADLVTERTNHPLVMSPWEQAQLVEAVFADLAQGPGERTAEQEERIAELRRVLLSFQRRWRALWAAHGEAEAGWAAYRAELADLERRLGGFERQLKLSNRLDAVSLIRNSLVRPALNAPEPAAVAVKKPAAPAVAAGRRFERPVFLVSPPRSGSSLLFETLAQSPSAWTVGGESHGLIEGIPALQPRHRDWESNRLTAGDAHPQVCERLTDAFFLGLRDREGRRPAAGAEDLRLLEKTPKNSLRVPFLAAAFPDALFVYLYRNPRESINSIYEAWLSGRFVTYPQLPGWPVPDRPPWSLLLIPGWGELSGRELPEIAARQWEIATRYLLDDLEALPAERWCIANYGRLVTDPQAEIERLCDFLGLGWDRELKAPLPLSAHTLTPPEPGKWRRNAALLEPVFPLVAATAERALEMFARRPGHAALELEEEGTRESSGRDGSGRQVGGSTRPEGDDLAPPLPEAKSAHLPFAAPTAASPLRSVFTSSLPAVLRQLGSSLLVSTYQSGRVIVVRAEGEALNTHFRSFPSPMGLALGPRYLAIGTARHVWEYRNVGAAARQLKPAGKHDACFLPRACHVTGDIRIHDMAFAGDELWVVNTRFSCLCGLDRDHSFVPRWRPPFVSGLAPEDRCHLNGLAVVGGRPAYVTALGVSDTPEGWRPDKAHGGVLLDVASGEVVAGRLSMPHSPRWHDGRLWVLESGKGEVGVVDLAAGRVETVAQLPGFTRGLAFAGPFAFVGLSQVRESVFAGIPLGARLKERVSGVWMIDLRSGTTAGLLRFEDAVQEIFDVALLPGLRFPELMEPDDELIASTYVVPDAALAEVAAARRA
ncbi:MAG: TIGR03032 family protein [Thermoanaerobaculia bacterium]